MASDSRSKDRTFSADEIGEIIDTATKLQQLADEHGALGDVSMGQLAEIASEIGIDDQTLSQAIKSGDRVAKSERKVARRKTRWFRHFGLYGVVVGGLALLDAVGGGGLTWFYFPAIGWAILLGVHAISAFERR